MIDKENQNKKIVINTSTTLGSTYSQLVGVSVTDIDITLEFVYINPRTQANAQVVSRITLPIEVGIKLAKTIIETTELHKNKKKGSQNG